MGNDNEIVKCPICGRNMLLKRGRYGVFWGCSNYPKCKGSIDAGKKKIKLEKLELININYDDLIENGEIDEIIAEVIENNKKAKEIIQDLKGIDKRLQCNNLCYKVLEYLDKNSRYIDISKFTYSIYKVRGELSNQFKYWINNKKYSTNYLEKDIKEIILKTWKVNIFSQMNLNLIGDEIFIGDFNAGGGKIDILAKNEKNSKDIIIEIKGPKSKGRMAWGQLKTYLDTYKNFYKEDAVGIIVSRGYAFGIYEKGFLFIGYVIEGNKLVFIPWKINE
ncbi:endonuclease NucS domain-containing protein [Clostridium tertium]|uniref:endonuclease NucS domain-containing protein n=1 Tax=Clostridium tertium TaxID=1559 RepID=UPI002027E9F6|nr:endonuclease NucS domain-containing protein [Clostridium tertium]